MIKIKRKEDYELCFVDYDLWNSSDNHYANDFLYKPWLENEYAMARTVDDKPIYQSIQGCDGKTMRAYIEKDADYIKNHYTFHEGDKLFFHKGCTIPRTRGEGMWQRVIKLSKADAIVVPELKKMTLMQNAALFVNENTKKIYVVSHVQRIDEPFNIGDSLRQVLDNNKTNIHKDFFDYNRASLANIDDAICSYKGDIMFYNEQCDWLLDVFESPYKKTIFEDELMQAIGTDEQKLSLETAESIMTMLRSSDAESVHAGMRALANMDYANYPSITRWMLAETSSNWQRYTPFNSAVKFMLTTINYKHFAREPFSKVMPAEFDITKEMFSEIIRKGMKNTIEHLQSMTNMKLRIDYDFDVSLNLSDGTCLGVKPAQIETKEEEIAEDDVEAKQDAEIQIDTEQIDEQEDFNDIDSDDDDSWIVDEIKELVETGAIQLEEENDETLEELIPDDPKKDPIQLEILFV